MNQIASASHQTEQFREPGLGWPRIGLERYRVPAMGVVALPLASGDEVELVDMQGLQVAHVAGFNARGESTTGSFGIPENICGTRMAHCLAVPDGAQLAKKLRKHNIDLARAKVSELLGGDSAPGNGTSWVCGEDSLCLICAPGDDMGVAPHEGAYPPPSELLVFVRRAHRQERNVAKPSPTPLSALLADAAEEIRILQSTAVAYEVLAGDYIQVIDVEGRQCSDFQCFDRAGLERGRERCLDATSTRSLVGSAYPTPGLSSKFYDVDFQPLVEVIQDTCGRHDSFGLACNAKYYDDAGYPGHINCSDNFNLALSPYPIAPRKGWMAMNLFFNTFFDGAYQLAFDEPWSRPGDYVLMQALTDIVCVSSACPCDIDAANGWNPTDIHVRIYPHNNMFKRSIAFRKTTDSNPQMTKETGFHTRTSALTRNYGEYNGYWLANDFNNLGNIAEYWACRENVIVTDLSPLRKAEVIGPDAELLMQTCVTRDMRRISQGQVVYTAMCYESGGMIDDGTVFRLGKDNFRWIGGNDISCNWLREQAVKLGLQAWVKESTEQMHNLQVQGPKSFSVLRKIIWTRPDQPAIDELEWFRFCIARIGGEQGVPILVSRTGYTGELGYEVFCHPKHAEQVWDAVWTAGQEFSIKPLGLQALDLLRIEAGLIFAGYEFCDQTDPFEAGIGFTVPLRTKQDDFIGRDALIKRKDNPQRKLVGLEVSGEQPAANGDGVFVGTQRVGVITSGMVSPILRKNIALCRVDIKYSVIETRLEVGKIDGHQKRIPCKVVAFPHFDPKKERLRISVRG